MYFSVAGIEISPWIPPAVAFVISFCTSIGGISGAFLILPFQVSVLGFASPAVSATNQVFNLVATPSGVYRFIREGRMVWPLTWCIILGTLPGVLIGVLLRVRYLPDPVNFKLFAGVVLLYIGFRLLTDVLKKKTISDTYTTAEKRFQTDAKSTNSEEDNNLQRVSVTRNSLLHIEYDFCGQTFNVRTQGIIILSFFTGIIGGAYGVGGGAIIIPFLISFYRLPIYTITGPALAGTFSTSLAGVILFQCIAPFYPETTVAPDWQLGLLFGLGGFFGIYLGSRVQKFIPAKSIKLLLSFCILFPAIRYIWTFFTRL